MPLSPITPTPTPPLEGAPRPLQVLLAVLAHLDGVSDTLKGAFAGVVRPGGKVQWRRYLSAVAQAGADLIDLEPNFFRWLSFSSNDLRTIERQVFQLGEIRSFLAELSEHVDGLLLAFKEELVGKTDELLNGLNGLLANPMLSPEDRARLEKRARALFDIIAAENAASLQKREDNRAIRAERDQLATENEELRKKLAPVEPVAVTLAPPPAPAGRRGQRRGRR